MVFRREMIELTAVAISVAVGVVAKVVTAAPLAAGVTP